VQIFGKNSVDKTGKNMYKQTITSSLKARALRKWSSGAYPGGVIMMDWECPVGKQPRFQGCLFYLNIDNII
jgi:hypothetical protein